MDYEGELPDREEPLAEELIKHCFVCGEEGVSRHDYISWMLKCPRCDDVYWTERNAVDRVLSDDRTFYHLDGRISRIPYVDHSREHVPCPA